MQQELLVLLASSMTKEQLIERLDESLNEYKEARLLGNDESEKLNFLAFNCTLLLANLMTKGDMKNAMSTIVDMQKIKDREKLFNPNSN